MPRDFARTHRTPRCFDTIDAEQCLSRPGDRTRSRCSLDRIEQSGVVGIPILPSLRMLTSSSPEQAVGDWRWVGRRGDAWWLPSRASRVLALAVRLAHFGESFFADELYTFKASTGPTLSSVLRDVNSDIEITPPLFFVVAWLSRTAGRNRAEHVAVVGGLCAHDGRRDVHPLHEHLRSGGAGRMGDRGSQRANQAAVGGRPQRGCAVSSMAARPRCGSDCADREDHRRGVSVRLGERTGPTHPTPCRRRLWAARQHGAVDQFRTPCDRGRSWRRRSAVAVAIAPLARSVIRGSFDRGAGAGGAGRGGAVLARGRQRVPPAEPHIVTACDRARLRSVASCVATRHVGRGDHIRRHWSRVRNDRFAQSRVA